MVKLGLALGFAKGQRSFSNAAHETGAPRAQRGAAILNYSEFSNTRKSGRCRPLLERVKAERYASALNGAILLKTPSQNGLFLIHSFYRKTRGDWP